MKDIIKGALMSGVILLGAAVLGIYYNEGIVREISSAKRLAEEREDLYFKTVRIADKNRDGRTTLDEWAGVYKELGIHFDELNLHQLTNKELGDYLFKHRDSFPGYVPTTEEQFKAEKQ